MAPTASRARPNARKRLDDSAFIGPSGTKRTLADRDGRQRDRDSATDDLARVKRKRTDQINLPAASSANAYAQDDDSGLVVDFSLLPTTALHKYIIKWDLFPLIIPGPYSIEPPPPPSSLLVAPRAASPSAVAAVRRAQQSRDPQTSQTLRRSSRLQDDLEASLGKDAVLADVVAVHDVLAAICQRHWEQQPAKETDAVVHFLHAIRVRNTQLAAGLSSVSDT